MQKSRKVHSIRREISRNEPRTDTDVKISTKAHCAISSVFKILDMNDIKKTQIELLEMKTTISEGKNTLDGIKNKLDTAQENISDKKIQQ